MDQLPRLPDEYLDRARELVARHRTVRSCKQCYDRGYRGVNQNNMLIPCSKCTDTDALRRAWQAYVRETPELAVLYGDYFEEEQEAEES